MILTDVCIDVEMSTKKRGRDISWSFGTCNNDRTYGSNNDYTQTCCFSTSPTRWVYQLDCKDAGGNGWRGAYITINGKEYCKDFSSGAIQTDYIEAYPSTY